MKKYSHPEMTIIEMETATLIAESLQDGSSVSFNDQNTTNMYSDRKRSSDWTNYEGQ